MASAVARFLTFAYVAATSAICLAAPPPEGKSAAQTADVCEPSADHMVPAACAQPPRIRPYEPIYGVYQIAEGDERAFRLHYSLRYVMLTPNCLSDYQAAYESGGEMTKERKEAIGKTLADCNREFIDRRYEAYLMYTGEFDFYMGTRDSGPVVNRISNPGAHLRWYFEKDRKPGLRLRWFDVGVEHRSNGQTTNADERTPDGMLRSEIEYRSGNHAYLDSISQDTNYVVLEGKFNVRGSDEAREPEKSGTEIWARFKPLYFANETAITWGPMASRNPPISDYDRFRFLVSYKLGEQRKIYIDWMLGDKGLKTDSFNLGVYLPFNCFGFDIPLYVRAHYGPMHTLSDFTRKQNAIGVGVLLLP